MLHSTLKSKLILALAIFLVLSPSLFVISMQGQVLGESQSHDKWEPTIKPPKYIFLFIGDGMGITQINLTEATLSDTRIEPKQITLGKLNFQQFPVVGIAKTFAANRYITGSAAAGTALASGHKTSINTIGKNFDHSENFESIAEMAKAKGLKVGIVTSVSIDHATPASFYAHENDRESAFEIASQMSTSNFDYFGGGYSIGDLDKDRSSQITKKMKSTGYKIVTTRDQLKNIKPDQKVWAYNHTYDRSAALYYEIDRPADHLSLSEFTEAGIKLLDNENGFFMMVEGGKIDWTCHANDAVTMTHEVIAFDKAIGEAIDFYNEHPDETLIIVTADHETGGLTLGNVKLKYETHFDLLKYQNISSDMFTSKLMQKAKEKVLTYDYAKEQMKLHFGLGDESKGLALTPEEETKLKEAFEVSIKAESSYDLGIIYGVHDKFTVTITEILANKAGINWSSKAHTASPVPVFAMGQGAMLFTGYYDNTDIAKKIMQLCDLK